MELTTQQKDFIEAVINTDSSIILEAVAGSGKTTTLVAAINAFSKKFPSKTIGCIAFNKRIADEMGTKVPNATCHTFNAFGHRAWMAHIGRSCKLNKNKIWDISNSFRNDYEKESLTDARNLVDKAKSHGLVPNKCMGRKSCKPLMEDTEENWLRLLEVYDIDCAGKESTVIYLARKMLQASIEQALGGVIDFNDQIYMTACWRAKLPKFDFLVVDEAQDVSRIQREMIRRMAKRLIAAGDRNQAIYAFRGASHTSMDDFAEMFNCIQMPLTVSFRCPRAIVREAQSYVPHIESAPGAAEGKVLRLKEFDTSMIFDDEINSGITPHGGKCAIACRNNAPLIGIAFTCMAQGIGVTVLGREIGTGLIKLIRQFQKQSVSIEHLNQHLAEYKERRGRELEAQKKYKQMHNLFDKVESIFAISQVKGNQGVDDINELISYIEEMFQDGGRVILGTGHKLKGLEFPNVFFLDRDLIPSKWARTEEALQQETNLAYVMTTRSLGNLIYVSSPEVKETF